ncbi:MAG: hypothetical protein M1821_004886 [Bathelium mastoideum]|nr:MAG: hypothetical protein M1821_004886 [Bathelium mastoideum]
MLHPKHARLAFFLCLACCVPILFLSVYFLNPHRIASLAFPSPDGSESEAHLEVIAEVQTSTSIISLSPTPSPSSTASIQTPLSPTSTKLANQSANPSPSETTHPLPDDEYTEDFLSAALGNLESSPEEEGWTFDVQRDSGDYGLSDWQCQAAFPQLYAELNRALAYVHIEGNITIEDVDISWKERGLVRAMIYDRVLYVIEAKYEPYSLDIIRALAILGSIHRAITAFKGPIPNIEFTFSVEDIANLDNPGKWPLWALARAHDHEEHWVMPDFGFWAWDTDLVGSYEQVRQGIIAQEPDIFDKKPQAIWRGAALAEYNSIRRDLLDVTKDKEWADVREVVWEQVPDDKSNHFVKIVDHCNYLFLIQTEGTLLDIVVTNYSGRLKYLLNCHSVSVIHKREWVENFHHLLVAEGPDQNYIEVERNFSNLPEQIERLLDQPEEIQRIADNSVATFRDRYLTPAAQACYWRRLFWAWSSVSFKPQLYKKVVTILDEEWNITDTKLEWRGEPYQTYLMTTVRDLRPTPPPKECSWVTKVFRLCHS